MKPIKELICPELILYTGVHNNERKMGIIIDIGTKFLIKIGETHLPNLVIVVIDFVNEYE